MLQLAQAGRGQPRDTAAEGQPATWQPRPAEEIARITSLVKSAVLFNEQRGDVVTVESAAFARPDTSLDGGEAPGAFDLDKFDLLHIGEIVALLLTALALVFFVLRPLVSGLFAKPEPSDLPPEIAALKGAKRAKAIAAMQAGDWDKARELFRRELRHFAAHAGACAAVVAGIPAGRRLMMAYTLSGALAGLAGLLWVGRYSIAFTMSSTTFLASPKTIMVLSM